MNSKTKNERIAYIIISPVRNEEKYFAGILESVTNQTIKPSEWIIVNDGSTDRTEEILKDYIAMNPWIRIINKKDRGFTEVGRGVVEAFNEGLKNLVNNDWDYVVKLDCDLSLEFDYFERLFYEFLKDDKLGIAGGTTYVFENGKLFKEKAPLFHPMAAARVYRKECFKQISGLAECLGWDTIDLLRAQMQGWKTKRFPEFKIIHHRRMSSRKGLWEGKIRTGKNFYVTGYHPFFLIVRCIYRLKERPYFIESIGVICGYLGAMWKREPLVVSHDEKRFFQRQQLKRLRESLNYLKLF